MFQIGVLSHIHLQAGKIDLILLVIVALSLLSRIKLDDIVLIGFVSGFIMGFISAEPILLVILYYLGASVLAFVIRTRVWKIPLITMFFCVGVSMFFHLTLFGGYLLLLTDAKIAFSDIFQGVLMPSLMLNIILVIPVYFLVNEIWRWFYPYEEEE